MRSFLFPSFNRAFLRGSLTTTRVTCGWSRSYSQAAQVPSSKFTCKLPRSPRKHWRITSALVSRMASITSLPVQSRTATEIVAWCTSSPIYLASFMRVLLVVGGDANDQNLLQRAPFYNPFYNAFLRTYPHPFHLAVRCFEAPRNRQT